MRNTPKLPIFLERKLFKTGQTRGADDDQIYQNRVGRNSTVLIPLSIWRQLPVVQKVEYENGFIVLVPPTEYFRKNGQRELIQDGVTVGVNALVFYQLRTDWLRWPPDQHSLEIANSRVHPLGGHYVARIANTTAKGDDRLNLGYTSKGLKGAGIRLYEYAPLTVIKSARAQLEALLWLAYDAIDTYVEAGMSVADAKARRVYCIETAANDGLLDYDQLHVARAIDAEKALV